MSPKQYYIDMIHIPPSNVLYYDVDIHRIKLASHARFDQGMNDFPMTDNPLNFQHLQTVNNGKLFPEEHPPPPLTVSLNYSSIPSQNFLL